MTTTLESRPLSAHPQRPWRATHQPPRRNSRIAERTFAAPIVRELPPRREQRAAVGTW